MTALQEPRGHSDVRVRPIESLAELAAAWRLVADVLQQDDTHPRNYAFYARHFPAHPQLLLVAFPPSRYASGQIVADENATRERAAGRSAVAGVETLCGALLAHAEPDYVWVGKLAVDAAYRGAGAGSALLALLEQNAAAAGHRSVMLGAAPDAEPFYTHRGYHPTLLRREPDGPPQRVFAKTL
jgi:GNAT superfamily N-acetyltransferase